jgi:ATP phosphoribosyltransferase regulatory subunit
VLSALIGDGVPAEIKDELFTCIKRKNAGGIIELASAYSLDKKRFEALAYAVSLNGNAHEVITALKNISYITNCDGLKELDEVVDSLNSLGYKDNIGIDLSVVNDMNYYRSLIFRGYVDCVPEAILSGGRYDDLVKKMGRDCGALGFAVALDRLQDLTKVDFDGASAILVYSDNVTASDVMNASDAIRASGYSVEIMSNKEKISKSAKVFYITPNGVREDENA